MTYRVSLAACSNYVREGVQNALAEVLDPLGGMTAFVSPGQKVLIKPNMLSGKTPDKAVTTHPGIVREVIRLAQRAGGIVSVGDSPGIGAPRQVARSCGIMAVIEETGASFAAFGESVKVHSGGSTFHELEIARDVLEADVVINLPKLKTHQMMGLTCGVKNLFGAVVGMRKPRLHLQAGTDKSFFALMLLELAEYIRPALTIVDAVTAMEGDGPGSGDPVHIGALLAGTSSLAVDTVATELVGIPPSAIWTQRVALETARFGSRIEEINLLGAEPASLRPRRFRPAKSTDVNFGLPSFLRKPLKQALTARPDPNISLCELCGLCARHCPPEVMEISDGKLHIDHERCIRCFCCQELCPKGALITRQGLLLRLSRFLRGGQ